SRSSAMTPVSSMRPLRAWHMSTYWSARTTPGRSRSAVASRSAELASPTSGCPCWRFDVTTSTGSLSALLEAERHGVHAVAVPGGGLRRVGEDVSQVGVAAGAAHLGADHAQGAVLEEGDRVGVLRGEEARPAA